MNGRSRQPGELEVGSAGADMPSGMVSDTDSGKTAAGWPFGVSADTYSWFQIALELFQVLLNPVKQVGDLGKDLAAVCRDKDFVVECLGKDLVVEALDKDPVVEALDKDLVGLKVPCRLLSHIAYPYARALHDRA